MKFIKIVKPSVQVSVEQREREEKEQVLFSRYGIRGDIVIHYSVWVCGLDVVAELKDKTKEIRTSTSGSVYSSWTKGQNEC